MEVKGKVAPIGFNPLLMTRSLDDSLNEPTKEGTSNINFHTSD